MSANFYDLLKCAATGIASQSMTYFDRMRASSLMGGGAVQTLTGIPPLTFKADGTPLISWSMKGNGQQTGAPTPDTPIMPEFVGVRMGNLFDDSNASMGTWINNDGSTIPASYAAYQSVVIGQTTNFIIKYHGNRPYSYSMAFYDSNGDFISRIHIASPSSTYDNFIVPEGAISAIFQVACVTTETITIAVLQGYKLMLNTGSTALPYEPYGYKIPITNAGQTTPVYLGQTPTVRKIRKLVLTGEEYWAKWNLGSDAYQRYFYTMPSTEAAISGLSAICTHFSAISENTQECFRFSRNNGLFVQPLVVVLKSRLASDDAAAWKSYLATQYANGTPVTVWYVLAEPTTGIINEPLAKIGDYADELHSTDAAVTIPTAKGQNVLTVDTELQPSEMTITYKE